MPGGKVRVPGLAAALLAGAAVAVIAWWRGPSAPATFVGSTQCAGCHAQAFADWQQSHHHHAMHPATSQWVLGDFDGARFEHAGISSRFFTRDGGYFVETDGADGRVQEFRIAWTFGWQPLQQYLVEFPDGRLQALGIAWDSRDAAVGGQRWFHLYPDEAPTHEDPLHWTGAFQNWNSRCASCHTTGLEKNYDATNDRYDTRWHEADVGCEACHGPASRHLAWARGRRLIAGRGFELKLAASWTPVDGRRDIPAMPASINMQLATCGGCHSRRTELGTPDVTRGFLHSYLPDLLPEGMYHADGQILDEVFEFGSFMQSRMHQNHVSCTNCHEPHGARLRASGNALCLACHEPARYEAYEHHFHEPDTPGSRCVGCHMPARTYMGVDVRHDHSFRVPDPRASLESGVPNACHACHQDRGDEWAADFLASRTGRSVPRYAHAALVEGARRGDPAVAPALLEFAGEPANPAILRAVALRESARFPSQQQVDVVAGALVDADPLLRMAAAGALDFLPPAQRLRALHPLLADPQKAVRITAARHLADMRVAAAPEADRGLLQQVFDEYRAALLHNADLPESLNELGLFLAAQGDLEGAEKCFLDARRLAPRYLPAMLNLADAWRARGRDDLGEPLLREVLAAWPDSGDAHHMLGLLYVRTGRSEESVALFRRARELSPRNPRFALAHAMALAETGRRADAIRELETAALRFPADAAIRDALEAYRGGDGSR